MKSSIYDYTSDAKMTPPPGWARKLGTFFRTVITGEKAVPSVPDVDKSGIDSSTSPYDQNSNFTSLPNMWRIHMDRKSMYQDIDRMDAEDELVNTALDIIADFAVCYDQNGESSFRIESNDKKTKDCLDKLIARLDLANEMWQIVRGMVKHGNEMREVIVDRKAMKIVALKQTISFTIYPKITERGDKVPGWIVMTEKDVYNGQGGTELEEWQIVPFMYGSRRGYLSVPILASARRNWQRLSKIEDGMAIARLVRAYDKLVHRVPVKQEWTKEEIMASLRRYKDTITKRKIMSSEGTVTQNENPLDVQTDFFLPDLGDGRGGVSVLNSTNLQLGNLNDVYYHRERTLARLRVPISYLQIMSSMKTHLKSGGSVSDVDIQFARMIRGIHANLRRGMKRLFDMELVLNGIVPGNYAIELPQIETDNLLENAKIELTLAQAAAYFVEAFGALPPALIAAKWVNLSPEQQKIMDSFLKEDGQKILDAKIKALETAAMPKPTGFGGGPAKDRVAGGNTGSGNNNKTKAANSSQQKGGAAQSMVPLEDAADLFFTLHQAAYQSLIDAGFEIPDMEDSFKDVVRQNLTDIATAGDYIGVGDED